MNSVDLEELHQELQRHDAEEPKPALARLAILQEPTTEALMDVGQNRSRCISIQSAEAGGFFNGHSMKGESRAKAFAVINVGWDGGVISAERRTAGSLTLENPAITLGFAMQPATMMAFSDQVGGLERGTGFIARFLFSNPESTQGTRKFREPPAELAALKGFADRVKQLLKTPLTYDESWRLQPPVLSFTPDGKAAWVEFYDDVERELGPGGEMSDAKDIASKAADNVARLAALFHVFEHGPNGNIQAASVQAAARIVTWHLFQSRRFFCELAPTPEMVNAQKLEAWLIRRIRDTGETRIKTQVALNLGPSATRHRQQLDAALAVLIKAKRARKVRPSGRTELIEVNPLLMEAT